MAEAPARTIIHPDKLFAHGPAYSTRSRMNQPELDNSPDNDQENTQEFLSNSFIQENELQPSEHVPRAESVLSSLERDLDDESNLSRAQITDEIDDFAGGVQSERSSSPVIFQSRSAREPVPLVQNIRDN